MWTFRIGLVGLALLSGMNWYGLDNPIHPSNAVEPSNWKATTSLEDATLTSDDATCDTWTGARYRCGQAAWEWVGRHVGNVQKEGIADRRSCIWFHPRGTGTNRLVFHKVRLGSRVTGYVGLLDSAKEGKPITVKVSIADTTRKSLLLSDRRKGWLTVDIDTAKQCDEYADISVELQTKAVGWRHVCFQLEVQESASSRTTDDSAP